MENCRPIVMRLATLILLACCVAALTACQSLSDVKPGDGRKETFRGYTYDQVWSAAVKVADDLQR